MKRLLLTTATVLLSLSSAVAFAAPDQEHGKSHDNGKGHSEDRGRTDEHRGDRTEERNDNRGDRRDGDEGHRYARGHRAHHDHGLHLGQFRRGERVPEMYRQQRYYVTDYRAYHLAPPPAGYRWVQPDNGRYLLISTATGLIAQMLGY